MEDRKFLILFGVIVGVGLLFTIIHLVYACVTYPNASIIQFIAREWWG